MNPEFIRALKTLVEEQGEIPVPTNKWRNELLQRCRESISQASFLDLASHFFPRAVVGAAFAACLIMSLQTAVRVDEEDPLDELFSDAEYSEELL